MSKGLAVDRLTALRVSRAKSPGLYPDGRGLYLQVAAGGARSWILRYRHGDKRRDMGLGSLALVGLSQARQKAADSRKLLDGGIDPIEARNASHAALAAQAARSVTFEAAATDCVADRTAGWRNAKHAAQWMATLKTYAFPTLGKLPVSAIDTTLVLKVLKPIWTTKTETAARVRGRIETVLDWAKAHKYRDGDNPARWRGTLDQVLPPRTKVRTVEHHPALPFAEMGQFMRDLRARNGTAARAFELLILTATRTREAIHATGDEFDLKTGVWTVPKSRTKSAKEHRIPLTPAAVAALRAMGEPKAGAFVFPGGKRGKPLSTGALLALLKRMERTDITPHGFRSTFRDWAAAQTNFPREVAELALSRVVGSRVERAYQRDDLLTKRVKLMEAWARHCAAVAKNGNVVTMRRA